MFKNIAFSLLIICLFLFNFSLCQDLDQDAMKAVACISLIKKLDNKNLDQRLISGYMLSCFINIDDTQVTKLISNQFSNGISLEKEEIDKLIDFSSFQSKYSQNDIKQFSERLNSALEKLKNQNMGGDRPSSSKGGKDKSSKKSADSVTLFEFLINGLIGLFNPKDSFLFLIGFFVLVYFGLKGLRKLFVGKNTNNNKKRKKQE